MRENFHFIFQIVVMTFLNHHWNPKRMVDLSEPELSFKRQYFKFFLPRRRLGKIYVQQIHNRFLVKNIEGFKKMQREEFRCIDIYFKNYAPHRDQIFKVLIDNKDAISKEILNP